MASRYRLWKEEDGGGLTEIDLNADHVELETLDVAYDYGRKLSFKVHVENYTLPFGYNDFIILADVNYRAGDYTTPIFEGYVQNPTPVSARVVQYEAYDATKRAGDELTVMSGHSTEETEVPRAIYNVKIESGDDDFALEIEHNATVGEIIQSLLDNLETELEGLYAAPDQVYYPGKKPYDADDLAALDMAPQEKVVFQSAKLRPALSQMLQWHPEQRMLFHVGEGERQWRLVNVKTAPQITLTLNQFDPAVTAHPVLSLDLQRSTDRRFTALKFYGPPQIEMDTVSLTSGTLDRLWPAGQEALLKGVGFITGHNLYPDVYRKFQIANPNKRRLVQQLPEEIFVPVHDGLGANLTFIKSRYPSLQVRFGSQTWYPVTGFRLDKQAGIIEITAGHLHSRSDGEIVWPSDVRFIFGYLDEPITVRYPETGFTGTAFTEGGLEIEERIYMPDLVTGYEFHRAVTSAEREAQFAKLAQNIVTVVSDIVYAGGFVLNGLDYDRFLNLGARINFEAVVDGDLITTGWEAIDAIVTDASFDLENAQTTVTLSSDHLEFSNIDPDALKQRLKIRAMQTLIERRFSLSVTPQGATQEFVDIFHHVPVDNTEPDIGLDLE